MANLETNTCKVLVLPTREPKTSKIVKHLTYEELKASSRKLVVEIVSTKPKVIKFNDAVFAEQGYFVARKMLSEELVDTLRENALNALNPTIGPAEYEVEVGYPGSPRSTSEPGGQTPRRLLHAIGRAPAFLELATSSAIVSRLENLMGTRDLWLSQNHHNCVMTKHPGYSSSTSWHQDIRYWSFDRPELISIWCALGPEHEGNGALSVIPKSHLQTVPRGRLDRDLFLRSDLPSNHALLASQVQIELEAGDVLFFHCRLFHAARRNSTQEVKLSVIFTYHTGSNRPIPGTRSDRYPPIQLNPGSP